jgi:gliding motility-associated-like protein
MKSFLLIFLLITFSISAQVGKEAWHWQFGWGCSLDFSAVNPSQGICPIVTFEGSASISDANTGQLLFYTDGSTVYDKNNNIMTNGIGLEGNYSSTQSALIIPKPNSSTIYYLVSSDQGGYLAPNQGVHYSIVDMSLNGGFGDVTTKNVMLTAPPTTEKLVGVKHCDGIDYWIITHPFNSNAFNAYLVTENGIKSTPVVSNVGTINQNLSGSYNATIGYLKASPNGKKLALAISFDTPLVEIFDFDNFSGKVSNPITINYPQNYSPYGISFSPDNSKLYVNPGDSSNIYQYDLSSGVGSSIISSETIIGSYNYKWINIVALQMAPDGKIYAVDSPGSSVSVINNPNALGLACNFVPDVYMYIWGATVEFGLPNFIDANNVNTIYRTIDTSFCSTSFMVNPNIINLGSQWSTGDTNQSISVNSTGSYWVILQTQSGCIVDTFNLTSLFNPIKLGNDTTICIGEKLLNASYPNSTYLWSTNETTPLITASHAGIYWVETNTEGCINSDTIVIYTDSTKLNPIIPNIVTPNNDGINDYIDFRVYQFSSLQLNVFNRWGDKVFESSNPTCIWKPTEDDGTYYYTAQYQINCGAETQNKTLKGFITLIR